MKPAIIAAMGEGREIGLKEGLPWHLPADLNHFKRMTLGHHLIMGRKTFESVGCPLPGRTTIVVSRNPGFSAKGVLVANSVPSALSLVRGDDQPFLAGGAGIYRAGFEVAQTMYLTLVHGRFEADTFFPEFDQSLWNLTAEERFEADEVNSYAYTFMTYERNF